MRHVLSIIALLLITSIMCAAEPAAAPTETVPLWLQILTALLGTVFTAFLLPYLKQKAAAAQAEAAGAKIDASKSLIEQRGVLMERLKSYLWGTAAAIAEDRFPKLATKIIAGQLCTKEQVKAELYSWGDELRTKAVEYFKTQGIDLISEFGEKALDDLIERAANAVSPFPGKETAVAVLEKNVAPMVISHGVEWIKKAVEKYGTVPTPAVPGPTPGSASDTAIVTVPH